LSARLRIWGVAYILDIKPNMVKLTFFGGAQEVTGACYLLETDTVRILIDCGMFQCPRFCEMRNVDKFPFDPISIDALFVTHGHMDHIGRVPKLVRDGFKGTIYSTPPTKDFSNIMLRDSLGIMEKEARHHEEKLFYSEEDIEKAASMWQGVPYGQKITIGNLSLILRDAGHILGSAIVDIDADNNGTHVRLAFTGDLGNSPTPILSPKEQVTGIEYLTIESAYGDRIHEDKADRKIKLERVIEDTIKAGGTLMIPAFSLERTQELLFELNDLVEHGRIPRVPVFIDSPLAINATTVYRNYSAYFNKDAQALIQSGDDLFKFPGLKLTKSTDDSKAINDVPAPKIIMAGAGMMQGGRILHHARRYLPDSKNAILFVGYQASGSLGRRILEGASEAVIHGERIPIHAKAYDIGSYSAHADSDMLFDYVAGAREGLKKVFVVQGEPKAALYLVQRIKDNLGLEALAPHLGDSFILAE